ncbi:MAG: TrkH family potassium uptake protein [Parvularculaceae bacterium]
MRIFPVLRVMGGLFIGAALLMALPFAVSFSAKTPDASYFLTAIIAAFFTGVTLMVVSASSEPFTMTRRQTFLLTGLAWTVVPAFAAIPFLGAGLTYAGAYFETVSGLTTTGSTVMVGLDTTSKGLLLWRGILQGVGGVGIVVIAIVVLPFLRVGGMQLFKTESSDSSEKIFARGLDLARWIAGIYVGLVAICATVFGLLGMTAFDAVIHAMTTISTAGFANYDASFGYFESPAIEWAAVVFMIAGALPFVAYIRTLRGRLFAVFNDVQARGLAIVIFTAVFAVALTHSLVNDVAFAEALRLSAFNLTSIITTTGFVSGDYQLWGPFAVGAFFIATFIGGCSGSTVGGIKIYRFQILAKLAHAHLTRIVSPSRATVVFYSTRRIDEEVEIAILTFLVAVLVSEAAFALVLSWLGLDLVTAVTAAAACLMNVGPGLGPIVGPAGNFAPLPDAAKAVLSLAMILGRLEFFTLLVMLTPAFWRG